MSHKQHGCYFIITTSLNIKLTNFVIKSGIEGSETGWIGNGGTTFRPIMLNDGSRSFYTIYSNDEGYWQIAFVEPEVGAA